MTDGRRDAVALRQFEEADDLVVALGGLGETALDGSAVSHAVINAALGCRLHGQESLDDLQELAERDGFAGWVIAQRAQHLIQLDLADGGAGSGEELGRVLRDGGEGFDAADNRERSRV